MPFYLCEDLGGALLHFFELPLLKFLQPHPVALEEMPCCYGRIKSWSKIFCNADTDILRVLSNKAIKTKQDIVGYSSVGLGQ